MIFTKFSSCMKEENNDQVVKILKPNKFDESDWFSTIEYVPLCTNIDNLLVRNILKIHIVDNYIYVLDEFNQKRRFFKFSIVGNLVGHIVGDEEGEKQFNEITDFIISKEGDIYLSDVTSNSILHFTSTCEYISSIKSPFENGIKNFEVFPNTNKITVRPEKPFSLSSSIYLSNLENLGEASPVNLENILNSNLAIDYPLMNFDNFQSNNNEVFYFDLFSNKIWSITANSVALKFKVEYEEEVWINKDEVDKFIKNDFYQQGRIVRNNKKAYRFDFFNSFKDKFVFSCTKPGFKILSIVDDNGNVLKNSKIKLVSNDRNMIDGGPSFKYLKGCYNESLIFEQNIEDILLYSSSDSVFSKKSNISSLIDIKENRTCYKVLVIAELK